MWKGESFFVMRTEDLVNPDMDDYQAPLVQRILASVGIERSEDEVLAALRRIRRTSLGSDTGQSLSGNTAAQLREVYGKWRKERHLFEGLAATDRAYLQAFGYEAP
jgi:hypothetical protein